MIHTASPPLSLQQRCDAYAATFPEWPAGWPHVVQEQGHDVLYAVWVTGQNYRSKSGFYGSYPPGYLDRVWALFPDLAVLQSSRILHAFSGSLPAGPYVRCDLVQPAELSCSIYDLADRAPQRFRLIFADPPYSPADAVKYGTPMVDRSRALRALAHALSPGGFLCWLDTTTPMYAKREWAHVGRIFIDRSTNHRVRKLSIFQRVGSL